MARKAKTTRSVLYKSYVFKDKDPIIDVTRGVVQDSAMSYQEVHEKSGVSIGTLNGWFNGKTLRPQFATINAVIRSCGHMLVPVKIKHGK